MARGLTIPLSLDTSSFDKQLEKSSLAIKNIAKNLDQFSTKKVNNDPNMLGKVYDTAQRKVKNLAGSVAIVKDQQNALLKLSQAYNLSTAAGRKEFSNQYQLYQKLRNLESSRLTDYNKIYNLQKEYTRLTGEEFKIRRGAAGYKDIQRLEKEVQLMREKARQAKKTNDEYKKFADIAKIAASYFSIQQIGQFFKRVADVGGELQKQRVALAGIVQDMSKANILFSQLKQQALESPFTFKHLIDGTRQLAAYNIENEKLYETQYMLSELSAGLGVEMNRLVLAYGQVKAATVLRGQEMRQFTEAGIPIIEALANKFTELEGRVVSTSEVFERVSNRMVSFKMVDEVMRKMTKEGGKFYKMQEKQAETIYGQMTNIRDAMEIMMLDIADQNEGVFLGAIKGIKLLIENWKILEHAIKAGAVVMIAYYIAKLGFHNILFRNYPKILAYMWGEETATRANIKATKALAAARTIAMNIAIGGAVLLLSYMYEQMAAESRYRKQLDESSSRSKDDYDNQLKQLKELIGRLGMAAAGSREFVEIRDKINSQYGQYLPRLIQESDGVKEIASMYGLAAKNMQNFYATRAKQELVANLDSQRKVASTIKLQEKNLTTSLVEGSGGNMPKKTAESFAKRFISEVVTEIKTGGNVETVVAEFSKNLDELGYSVTENIRTSMTRASRSISGTYTGAIQEIDNSVSNIFNASTIIATRNLEALKKIHRDTIESIRNDYNLLGFQKEMKIAALPTESQLSSMAMSMTGTPENAYMMFEDPQAFQNIKRMAGDLTITQQAVKSFFGSLSKGMSAEIAMSKNFGKAKQDEINNRSKAADAAYNELSALISLTDATEKYQSVADLEEQIKRDEAALKAQANLTAGTFAYANALKQLYIDKNKLQILKDFFSTIGITGDGKKAGTKTENPEIDRANRLVSLYREMYETYKKYSQFVTREEARRLTSAEFTDVYGELNKEMGGRLGPMSIIEDQTGLVQLLDKAVTGALIRTKDGVKVIKRALTSELGGQQLQNKQDSMESLQKQIEDALSGLMVEAPDSAAISIVESLIVKMGSEFGIRGGELASQFTSQIDKFKIDAALAALDRQMESLTVKRDLGRELSDIKSETGLDLSSVLSDRIVTYTEYLTQLEDLKNKYLLLGNDGTKKAADIDIQIEQSKYDRLKIYITETAKMQAQLYTTQQRRDAITMNISSLKEQIESAKKELEGATDELQNKNLNALINWLDMQAKLKQRELDSTDETLFQESQMYQHLYGDITEYSEKAYRDMLKSMEDMMLSATDIQDGDKKKKKFTYTFTDKDGVKQTQEIVISANRYASALAKINREQGKLSKNPFKEIFKDFKGFISKGSDGATSVDFSSLGAGLEGISSIMGQLQPIGEIMGLGEADMAGFNAITQGVGALARIAANPADIGAYVDLLQSYVGIMDWDNSKKIERAANAIKKLQASYDGLMTSFEDSVGFDNANAAFENLTYNLQRQEELYAEMAKQEKDKKRTDKQALEEYEKASIEAYKKRQELIKQQIAEWSTTVKSAAQQFTDAWVTAFQETGNGLSALDQTFEQVMLGIVKKQIQAKWMEKIVAPFVEQLNNAVDPNKELGFGISDAEARAIQASYKQVKFGAQEADAAMQAMLKLFGLDGKGESQYDTLQKGIQGITEDSAQIIASYMNSVRLEVVTIRQILESRYSSPQNAPTNGMDSMLAIQNIMNEFYPQYLNNLIAIKENTNFLRDAYDASRRGFRVS